MKKIYEEIIEDPNNMLPHGSGIDCDWEVKQCKNGRIICQNYFHKMDEWGGYCGFVGFKVEIFKYKTTEYNMLKGPCEGRVQVLCRPNDIDYKITCSNPILKEVLYSEVSNSRVTGYMTNRNETIALEEMHKEITRNKIKG